jgi:hypothetical protein
MQSRLKIVQQIYTRLARLEQELACYDFNSKMWVETSTEINSLREKLQQVMNSPCPLLKGG